MGDPSEFKNGYKDIFIGHIKIVSDGSNQGLTGFQMQSYECEPANNYGNFNFGDEFDKHPVQLPDRFLELFNIIIVKGYDMMVHANGTKAIEFTIQAFEQSLRTCKKENESRRHRIEHCSLVDKKQLERMSVMGVSPSFLIGHTGIWGYTFSQAIFEKTANYRLDLCQTAISTGCKITAHSDSCVTPIAGLRNVEQLVTRIMEQDPKRQVLNSKECLTIEQALMAQTCHAAWQCHADQWLGDLSIGKYADFCILEEDPVTMKDHTKLRDVKVLKTYCHGLEIYSLD